MCCFTGKNSSRRYVTITLNWVNRYSFRENTLAPYEPGFSWWLPVRLMSVRGIMRSVRRKGTSKAKRVTRDVNPLPNPPPLRGRDGWGVCEKKQNSYRVMMTGKVKAFSFVFMARIAERIDKINHRDHRNREPGTRDEGLGARDWCFVMSFPFANSPVKNRDSDHFLTSEDNKKWSLSLFFTKASLAF